MPRAASRQAVLPLPELLTHVVRSAEVERQRDAARWAGNHPAALVDLARIVAVAVPARGVLGAGRRAVQ